MGTLWRWQVCRQSVSIHSFELFSLTPVSPVLNSPSIETGYFQHQSKESTWVQYREIWAIMVMTMSERTESVINHALSLSPVERAELIERLYESMRSGREREIEQAWAQESERRIDELQSGKESTLRGIFSASLSFGSG